MRLLDLFCCEGGAAVGYARAGWDVTGVPRVAPRAEAGTDEGDEPQRARGQRDAGLTLLPTPAVNDMGRAYTPDEWDAWTEKMRAAHGNGNGHGASLHIEALRMLPTPRARDHIPESYDAGMRRQAPQLGTLAVAGVKGDIAWGDYAPAIARWEHALGRPAPAPTEANLEQWERRKVARLNSTLPVGMRGSIRFIVDGPPHRLSPRFVEWMMGLPDGHVTDVPDLSRNAQLKALGNGVVPQQAAAAVRWLLTVRSMEVAA